MFNKGSIWIKDSINKIKVFLITNFPIKNMYAVIKEASSGLYI